MALRAPELIKPHMWDQNIDIWAIGCLVSALSHLMRIII